MTDEHIYILGRKENGCWCRKPETCQLRDKSIRPRRELEQYENPNQPFGEDRYNTNVGR